MYALVAKDWRELSKAASQERDPKKLMELIDQLNEALEQLEAPRCGQETNPEADI